MVITVGVLGAVALDALKYTDAAAWFVFRGSAGLWCGEEIKSKPDAGIPGWPI